MRLNTAWSLGIAESPCYLRAKVIDSLNNPVPGVKIAFTTAHLNSGVAQHASGTKRDTRSQKPLFTSKVEALTGSRNYPIGVCLPVGCHDTGMLQASRLGNELVLLEPNAPASNMGSVKDMIVMTQNLRVYESVSNLSSTIDASLVHNCTNLTSHYAYFRTKDECRDTSPSLQTYVFHDNADAHDGSVLSRYRYNFRNNVILTFGIPNQRPNRPRPILKYCHVKVRVQYFLTFQYNGPIQIEVTTMRNRSSSSLLVLGWRSITLNPPSTHRQAVDTHHVCVEYVCGEIQLTDREQLVLRVTMREKNLPNATQTLEESGCRFIPLYYQSRTSNIITDHDPPDELSRSGYVYVQKMFNVSPRSYRTISHQREISNEFSATSLAGSKEKCLNSSPGDDVSAYFKCS